MMVGTCHFRAWSRHFQVTACDYSTKKYVPLNKQCFLICTLYIIMDSCHFQARSCHFQVTPCHSLTKAKSYTQKILLSGNLQASPFIRLAWRII